jgi:hypothetical protein
LWVGVGTWPGERDELLLAVVILRHEFDSERIPELSGPAFLQDIHSVSSLCKLYFRELPNPLLTYQLYGKFSVSKGTG